MNSDYLSILFKKLVISLIEYIQRERVEETKGINFHHLSLSDICASLNFNDKVISLKFLKNSPMKHLVNTENLMLSFKSDTSIKTKVFSVTINGKLEVLLYS